ncbi:sortase [Galbitalea sp. SE-J8]|uniref:sortase n=1 Tax=Galbitalea sp. SE-J8 TaxID=3054952 RepID=UPI00259CEBBD|nr:sortase [Galbitalea sp. SE-J8]MDM4761762.1 sortase [Galbitalea sp. SE-J8]
MTIAQRAAAPWGRLRAALATGLRRFAPARASASRPVAATVGIDPRPASGAVPSLSEPDRLRFSGAALVVVGAVLLGFAGYLGGISQLSALRDQQLALQSIRYDLANGTAPVGQVGADGRLLAAGTPVAVLAIPELGVRQVVLEGTDAGTTMSGPGHRRDTVLPGQAGSSVIYGRQAAYGAPFARIADLAVGDELTATTGQGEATYRVSGIRFTGDLVPAPLAAGAGRLTLVSGVGLPFAPSSVVRVDADLVSAPQPAPDRVLDYAALAPSELTMAGDSSAWPLLTLALVLLALALVVLALSRRLWGRWQTWIVAVPVLAAIGVLAAQRAAALLPNLI